MVICVACGRSGNAATGAINPGAEDVPDARVFAEFRAIRIIGR